MPRPHAKKTAKKPAKESAKKKTAPRSKVGAKTPADPRVSEATNKSPFAEYCRSLPHTTEDIKWENDLVFSIGGKMYAVFDIHDADHIGFKCDDIDFERLTQIDGIIPAPYAARFGWVKLTK